jgi:hypothetical protein
MNEKINIALLQIVKRAEMSEHGVLVDTFVDTGMLQALLTSRDHQVINGRRGTGKTHALLYLFEKKRVSGEICSYIDLRTVGSSVGVYTDNTLSISERATRLLRDVLATLHSQLLEIAIENSDQLDLSQMGHFLDAFYDAATQTQVLGTTTTEVTAGLTSSDEHGVSAGASAGNASSTINVSFSEKIAQVATTQQKQQYSGQIVHRVRFGAIGQALAAITKSIAPKRVWILLDEWSAVPLELQPYLADLIRRCILPVTGISVKIAAIELRSRFRIPGENGEYTGIEVGADVTADLNLDDFMVFEHSETKSVDFFQKLIFNHFKAIQSDASVGTNIATAEEFTRSAFTQRPVLEEIVRAAEGVPRDAINVLAICAQKAGSSPISVQHARAAAKSWYSRDKESAVSANVTAMALLRWIVDEVIAHRKARAFLIESGTRNALIDSLFDSRVLHLLKRNISAHDQPGVRYDAYKIDFGCYVDLLSTAREPQGLLPLDEIDDLEEKFAAIPPDDYRAIRRAILDLSAFHARQAQLPLLPI